jgi:hypothetical protein
MNKAEREHLAKVAAMGCIVCRNENLGESPAAIHHINCGAMGRRSSHRQAIGLCKPHHQDADGTSKYGGQIAVHRGLESFEKRYGTEEELLAQTLREIAET